MNQHQALKSGNSAVITGGASGVGFAVAKAFVGLGLNVMIADLRSKKLETAKRKLQEIAGQNSDKVFAYATDVSDLSSLEELECVAVRTFGKVHVLMNNACVQPASDIFGKQSPWERIIDVNMMGVINATRIFVPSMAEHGEPGLIINTGEKYDSTRPSGNPAYNVAKAGVKTFTEALQHDLRIKEGCKVEAHLLIPGFVFMPLTAGCQTKNPEDAWTAEQTADFIMERLTRRFLHSLPDGQVDCETDKQRVLWAVGDIGENRPPMPRWHPGY